MSSHPESDKLSDKLSEKHSESGASGASSGTSGGSAKVDEKSSRIIGAVAQLVQHVDAPKDRADRVEQVQASQSQLIRDYPRLINYGQGYDAAILANAGRATFAKDVEDEMKSCFQKMYEQQHDIQEVIAMLEKSKHSESPRDQDSFACMIHSLFDEYQFFPQYPVKASAATAVSFGSLVHFRLVEGVPLAIASKFVLDASRQDVDSNMFRFGLQASVESRQRLEEFPKYCKVLSTIPGLQKQHQFYAQIKAIADPDSDEERSDSFRSINFTADALDDDDAGPKNKELESALKRVSSLVNNSTAKNSAEKAQDAFREIEYVGATRFARILVSRAIHEANYHELYASLIDSSPPEIGNFCINVITGNMARISNSGDASSSDKRLSLKNLGQLSGMSTVAKDRPSSFNQVHLKSLLAEGVRYEKSPAVSPLVAKIMMQTANSKVFYRTSPWVQGVLAVLSELYTFGNLKLTMKFEIEVLGKAIGVAIPESAPAVYIRDETKQVEDSNAIATTFGGPAIGNNVLVSVAPPSLAAQQLAMGSVPANANTAVSSNAPNAPNATIGGGATDGRVVTDVPGMAEMTIPPGMAAPAGTPMHGATAAMFSNGAPTVGGAVGSAAVGGALGTTSVAGGAGVPSAGTTEFVTHPGSRQSLDMARSKTSVDVSSPVIDRAVSIASFTAKELVLKDSAREPDEGMSQAAARSQALVLASSMAIVTAKDPFIEASTHNSRSLMLAQGYGDAQSLMDQAQIAARETMESLVPLVESVAREKVVAEVDEASSPNYQARHFARAQNKPFEPENFVESPIESPESLAIRKGGSSPEQMSVYDNFAQQASRVFQENAPSAVPVVGAAAMGMANSGVVPGNHLGSSQTEIQQFTEVIRKLVDLTKAEPVSQKRLGDLDKDDDVSLASSSIVELAHTGARHSEEMPLRSSHVIVQASFGPESTRSVSCRECSCYTLGELCRMSSVTAKEVVSWSSYSDDPKKYNANVIGTSSRSRLVTPTEIDATLTKDLAEISVKPGVLEYAVRSSLDALIGPEPYCLRSDFAGTILAISRLDAQKYPAAGVLVNSLGETKGSGTGNEGHVFAEWTRLMQHHATASSPMSSHAFVRDSHSLGWGSSPDQSTKFICTAVSVSVQSYSQSRSFVGVDAVATSVTTSSQTTKGSDELAQTLFTIITMSVAQNHENGVEASNEASKAENPEKSDRNGDRNGESNSADTPNRKPKPSDKDFVGGTTVFEPLVYYRLSSSIANSLPERFVGLFAQHVLVSQPLAFPGFASYWMTLMSHRFVMGRSLDNNWPISFSLMKASLTFLRHIWSSSEVAPNVKNFVYRGVERICLVVSHDAPEFFVRYADEISASLVFEFVQSRNLVSCAFPEGVSSPHPIEMKEADYANVGPEIQASVEDARVLLTERKVNKLIENACSPRPQLTPQIVMAVQTALAYAKPIEDRGVDFNSVSVSMLGYNSSCTYVAHSYTQSPPASGKVEDSGAAQFCGRMLSTLSRENRYAFVSAIANHSRYPEKHTYFFSRFLSALFTSFGERMFKDGTVDARHVVTRVLLERLMAHRAHPWGSMATFAELSKSSQYNFWDMPFIKSSNESSELFSTSYTHISQSELQA